MLLIFCLTRLDGFVGTPWRMKMFPKAHERLRFGVHGSPSWRMKKSALPFPIYMEVCFQTLHPLHRGLQSAIQLDQNPQMVIKYLTHLSRESENLIVSMFLWQIA